MKPITIEVDDKTSTNLSELAVRCAEANKRLNGSTSHGSLTVPMLLAMLAEDAAMVISRPGSWEGSNMARVFASHGYDL